MNQNKIDDAVDILWLKTVKPVKKKIDKNWNIIEEKDYDILCEIDMIETSFGVFDKAIWY